MAVYLISNVKVTDEGWIPEYAAKVHGIVAKHGGKYLSRSGNVRAIKARGPTPRSWPSFSSPPWTPSRRS
jgi:uncharacterized protein (DUF1330 family)